MASTARRCEAITKLGQPCGAYAGDGSTFCFWHDPARVEERRQARAKGGRARHGRAIGPVDHVAPVVIEIPGDTLRILTEAINDVRALENSVARSRALGYLCGVVIKAFEVTELEGRMQALETILKEREGRK